MNYHDGKLVVTARTDTETHEVFLFDMITKEEIWKTFGGTGRVSPTSIKPAFSADSSIVVVNYQDGSNYAFNTNSGTVAWNTPPAVDTIYQGFALSTDGSTFFGANYLSSCATAEDYEPRVDAYNTATGDLVGSYNHANSVPCFCPDNLRIYCNNARSPVTVDSQNRVHYVDEIDGLVSVDGTTLDALGSANFDPDFEMVTRPYSPLVNGDDETKVYVQGTKYVAAFSNPAATVTWQSEIYAFRGSTLVPQDDLVIGPSDEATSGQCVCGIVGSGITCFDIVSGAPVWDFSAEYTKSFDVLSGSESIVFDDQTARVYLLSTVPAITEAPSEVPTMSPTTAAPTEAPSEVPTMSPTTMLPPGKTESPTAAPTTSAAVVGSWEKANVVVSVVIGTLVLLF